MFLPISNSESTKFFNEYSLWFHFWLANWEKAWFGPITGLFSISTAQTEKKTMKKLVKQTGDTSDEFIFWRSSPKEMWGFAK